MLTGSGCLSRVLGPVFVTYIYTEFGTVWTFGMTTIMMAVSMVWLLLFEKRLLTDDQNRTEDPGTELDEVNILVEKSQEPKSNGSANN